jgi:hypothetical protein
MTRISDYFYYNFFYFFERASNSFLYYKNACLR